MRHLALALLVVFAAAVAACIPDAGFDVHVTNPCDHQVTVRVVDYPAGTDPDARKSPTVREVRAFGSVHFGILPFDDIAVEVSAPALGWSVHWLRPETGESREFTIDPSVCRTDPSE